MTAQVVSIDELADKRFDLLRRLRTEKTRLYAECCLLNEQVEAREIRMAELGEEIVRLEAREDEVASSARIVSRGMW